MNAIFEKSSVTMEEPTENKGEYLANLLRIRSKYILWLLQSYHLEEYVINRGKVSC